MTLSRPGTQQSDLTANRAPRPVAQLDVKSAFLVWEAPRGAHRSEFLARHLGMDVRHVYVTKRKGRGIAPLKYIAHTLMTLAYLGRHRYRAVFVQNPPIFAVLTVYLFCLISGARYVIDSHTDALLAPFWRWSLPLHRFLSRRAMTTIVTNDYSMSLS